jgi:hypothetical protein
MSLVGATRNYIRKPFITEVLKMSSFSILVASIGYLLILLWIGKLVGQSLFASNMDMAILGLIFIVVLGYFDVLSLRRGLPFSDTWIRRTRRILFKETISASLLPLLISSVLQQLIHH